VPLRPHHIVIDAADLPGLARFWCAVLDWQVLSEREREVVIGPDVDAPIWICFMPSPDEKRVKNRVHLDLTTSADDRDAEIDRVLALGATRVDVGQTGDESWDVLADPEGNEFCVVRPKATLVQ
jgi:predicted enzyme related to lactoylglutathione lyase